MSVIACESHVMVVGMAAQLGILVALACCRGYQPGVRMGQDARRGWCCETAIGILVALACCEGADPVCGWAKMIGVGGAVKPPGVRMGQDARRRRCCETAKHDLLRRVVEREC